MGFTGFYEELAELAATGRAFVVATVTDVSGSTPQKPGSKMMVLDDGALRGTVGGGAVELQIVEAAKAMLSAAPGSSDDVATRTIETHLTHDLGMCCGGRMRVFLERHGATKRLVIYGAGHVSQELAKLASHVGFQITVVDERSEWISADRFPGARERVTRDPAAHAREEAGGVNAYYAVLTHDHALDQAVVEALLPRPGAYLGVIGSRRKAERFRMRLAAAGFTPAQQERLRSPMGVAIGAVGPREIAVSMVAELIAVSRGK